MQFKYRFSDMVICSRYFLFTFALEYILIIYFYFNPLEFFLQGAIITLIFTLFWFILFTSNYLYNSQDSIDINFSNKTIYLSGKEIPLDQLSSIEKIQSYKTSDSDFPYMPWFAGIYYFYRITYNERKYLITSFMLNGKETKKLDFIFMGNFRIRNRFFPFIF